MNECKKEWNFKHGVNISIEWNLMWSPVELGVLVKLCEHFPVLKDFLWLKS